MESAARRLGLRIREIRLRLMEQDSTYSLEGVARRLNWPTSRLRQIEMTRTTMIEPEEIRMIADALGVEPRELLAAAYGDLIGV